MVELIFCHNTVTPSPPPLFPKYVKENKKNQKKEELLTANPFLSIAVDYLIE
jgi:hypothetical protein